MITKAKTTWRKVKLGEIVDVNGGGTPSTSNPNYWGGNIAWLTPAEVVALRRNRFITKTERYITKEGLKNSSAKVMPVDSLLLTSRATIGEITINKVPMATNQGFINIEPKENDLMFLFYWLKKNKKFFNQMAIGSTFNELSKSVFKKIEILIPKDVNQQKRIADILSAFDDKIEMNNKTNQTLEQMASAIFKEWFVKFRFPRYKKVKMINSELGKIPKGWEVKSLGDGIFTKIISNGIDKFNGEKIYLATADVNGKDIANSEIKISYNKRPSRADMQPLINSVWFAKMINTYKVLFFFDQNEEDLQKYILSTGFMGIKCNNGLEFFIYIFVSSKKFHLIKDTLVQGAVQEALTLGNIKQLKILIPATEVLAKFNQIIKPMFCEIYKNKSENQKLASLRDLLLPKLMSGEIKV